MHTIITNSDELDIAIANLKRKKIEQKLLITEHFHEFQESIRPINLIKNGFHKIVGDSETRSLILKTAGGIGMGFLTKGLIGGKSTGVLGSMVSNTVKATITNSVVNNADKIKAYGLAIYHNLFQKK